MRCIDADELYGILSLLYDTEIVKEDKVARFIAEQTLFDIGKIPTADVQPVVHGEWNNIYYDDKENSCMCSICKSAFIFEVNEDLFNYCPDCGAKMDGGNDEPTT